MYYFRLLRLNEVGITNRENSRLYTKKPECNGGGGNFVNVSLVDTRAALTIFVSGIFVAIGVLAIEIIIHKRLLRYYISKRFKKETRSK